MKIRTRILIINNVAFVTILAGIGVVFLLQLRSYLLEHTEEKLRSANAAIVDTIETASEVSVRAHLRTIAETNRALVQTLYDDYKRGETSEEQAYNRAKRLLLDPEYGRIGETGYLAGVSSAGVLVIHPKSEGADASGHEFMQRAMSLKNGYLEYMWKNPGEERERAKAGWLAYFEPWDFMVWASSYKSEFTYLVDPADFRERVLETDLGDTGYAFLMDGNGTVIIHPEQEAGTNFYDAEDAYGVPFIRRMCETKNGRISYSWSNPGETQPRSKLAHFSYIDELDWIVVTTYYEDEVYQPLYTSVALLAGLFAVAVVVVFLLNLRIGTVISGPMHRISLQIRQRLSGSIDLATGLALEGNDEVTEVAQQFNGFAENVKGVIDNLRQVHERSTQIGRNLSVNSQQVSATVEEIARTIESSKNKTAALDAEIAESDRVADRIQAEVRTVTSRVEDHAASVTQSSAGIEEMIGTIRNLSGLAQRRQSQLDGVNQTVQQSEEDLSHTVAAIEEIADSATRISELVAMIDQVAEQTNMLAMNAAIEAAHAGEAGSGFAVVAEEVRRLSEATSEGAAEISGSIEGIVRGIGNTKTISESTMKAFSQMRAQIVEVTGGIREILDGMNEMSAGSEQVLAGVSTMNDFTQQVRGSTGEIGTSLQGVRHATERLRALSAENLEGMEQISRGMSEIVDSVTVLQELGAQNSANIQTIEGEVAKFTV